MIKVAIIGSAGRNEWAAKMSKSLFLKMVQAAHEAIIALKLKPENVCLVSGGAAWSDHVAVKLFQKGGFGDLELHLPCAWQKTRFDPENSFGIRSNELHAEFSEKMEIDSLKEIQLSGAEIHEHQGFFPRNNQIAKAPYLIAFSWGVSKPEEGGTKYTWNKCKGKKVHISLLDLYHRINR